MNNIFDWPLFALCDDIKPKIKELINKNKRFAVATLVDGEGSSPRPMGSQMLISEDKDVWGYVSGGCVESNLAEMAVDAIKSNKPCFVTFGYGSPYVDIKLLCGKKIDIAIDVFDADDKAVLKLLETSLMRKPCLWVGDIKNNKHFCFDKENVPEEFSEFLKLNTGIRDNFYWQNIVPNMRLIINGANPVAVALTVFAKKMGWEIVLNKEYGSELPKELEVDYYEKLSSDKLFKKFSLDYATAVVSITHDVEADHEILKHALLSDAFYVGVLGSRKHLPKRESLMKKDNIDLKYMEKLKAPIGLEIGADTANEIAIAILADIIKNFRLN